MKFDRVVLKGLDLTLAAKRVTTTPMDRLPALIVDACLQDAVSTLVTHVVAQATSGHLPTAETITMPRRGFGPRPVLVLSTVDRVLYSALVESIRASLPPTRRSREDWSAHDSFGLPGSEPTADYIVDTDVAAYYEYVEHATLAMELTVQTMNAARVESLIEFLTAAFGRARGLPQMSAESDLLADTYILALDRELLRRGFVLSRFADDYKILADSWAIANEVVEAAAGGARELGLVLSSEKTRVRKAATLVDRKTERDDFIQKYFDQAMDDMSFFELMDGDYGEIEESEETPDEDDAMDEAYHRIVNDWVSAPKDEPMLNTKFLGSALLRLQNASTRLSDEAIVEIAFWQPIRLEKIADYLTARAGEVAQNWATIAKLVAMERQSPWAKLWLLDMSTSQDSTGGGEDFNAVVEWAATQLADQHEVVRAEAAWFLANARALDLSQVSRLYDRATALSKPAIAACIGRQADLDSTPLLKSILSESKLNAAAHAWAGSL